MRVAKARFEPKPVDAADRTFRRYGREAAFRCALHRGLLCGLNCHSISSCECLLLTKRTQFLRQDAAHTFAHPANDPVAFVTS
jgi:hypothetical protein